jgi:hypothetical protein
MAHIRTVEYNKVKCPVCDLNILRRWRLVRREDHSEIPEETGSAVGDHVYQEVNKPLELFNPQTSIFYCDECKSILHHSVTERVDRPEQSKDINLVWSRDMDVT